MNPDWSASGTSGISSRVGTEQVDRRIHWSQFNATYSTVTGQFTDITGRVDSVYQESYSYFQLTRGEKRYEGSNHLGNVLVVFTDKKLRVCAPTGDTIHYYLADLIQASDYSPFGAPLENRTWQAEEGYRFGFNGMEKDKEVNGGEAEYGADFRQLNSNLGRWTSADQVESWYPHLTPYNSMNNNPILWVDPEGLWHREKHGKGSDKTEHLVADKGDNLETLDKYLNSRRNRKRYTDEQRKEIVEAVKAYGEENKTVHSSTRDLSLDHISYNYDGFDLDLTERFNLRIHIYVGYEDPKKGKTMYKKYGGHVGVEMNNTWYHYYYSNPRQYSSDYMTLPQWRHALKIYDGKIYTNDNEDDYYHYAGTHSGQDGYFDVPLSIADYNRLQFTLTQYANGVIPAPNYGILGKRCTSMSNTFLTKSGIGLVNFNFVRKIVYASYPKAYYNLLIKKYNFTVRYENNQRKN